MLLSLNWLSDYVGKPGQKIDPEDLAEKLTMRGVAVEKIRESAEGLESVLVGRIERIEKHPNADRLQVTHVSVSDNPSEPTLQIVCGAKNIMVGDLVPVAMVGTLLPGDLHIKKSEIRGVESFGMLCSGKELNIDKDSEGILQLPKHAKLGEPLSHLLGKSDTIMEFELTANRGDCLSVIGLAREIAPLLKSEIREPKPQKFQGSAHRTSNIIKVNVEDSQICPRYSALIIDNLKIADSPEWIKQRLISVGMRAVNQVVDVTNFVMMEYGQPLHAFDLRRIQSGEVRVASCKQPMDFTLLTGEIVKLEPGDILIQDGDKPIALAGIMGGLHSQVTEDTTSILLESAVFNAAQIRKTAKRLGLRTDASRRFERGGDTSRVITATERAAALLRDGFSANVYFPPVDTNDVAPNDTEITVDMREVRQTLGLPDLSLESVTEALDTMGIKATKKSQNVLIVRIPSYRLDLTESFEVVEEVARLIGYDRIPINTPRSVGSFQEFQDLEHDFDITLKTLLESLGLRESIHYSFTSEEKLRRFGAPLEDALILKNPLSDEMRVMRTSLLPSLIETYQYNLNRKITDQRLFEIANVYTKDKTSETSAIEKLTLAVLLSGKQTPAHWRGTSSDVDFFFAKGLLETIVSHVSNIELNFRPLRGHGLYHPAKAAEVVLNGDPIGTIGEIHPVTRRSSLENAEPLVLLEIRVNPLRKVPRAATYVTPSKFPGVEFDLAFIVDKAVSAEQIQHCIDREGGELLNKQRIFDVFEGTGIPMGKRSIAIRFNFSASDRTLTDPEVNALREKITAAVARDFSAQLRS